MESAAVPPGPCRRPGQSPCARQARFLREADQLKGVLRQSSILDGSRKENSAEHSWHLALMALVLREYAPPGTDLNRVTAMLLIHDLVEIDAGDLFVYADAAAQARQEAAEHAAADRIFALLPPAQGPGCAPSGTSSRSAAPLRRGSPGPWTGSSRCWPTTTWAAAPGRSTGSGPARCWTR